MTESRSAAASQGVAASVQLPETVEIETGPQPVNTIIWLHGLGADGHDFEPVVPMLGLERLQPTRVVFPHAPVRPVTINGGMRMRAWYDIRGMDVSRDQDREGIDASRALVEALIAREMQRGVPAGRIVLAGFSQGGAIAAYAGLRHQQALAGLLLLSCYLLMEDRVEAERHAANQRTPVFAGHGSLDPVVPVFMGRSMVRRLEGLGMPVEWHEYPIPHSVSADEIADMGRWLRARLRAPADRGD